MDLEGIVLGKLSKMQKVILHDCSYMWNQKIPNSETQNRGEMVRELRRLSAGRDHTQVKGVTRHKPPGTQYIKSWKCNVRHNDCSYEIYWVCESCQEDRSLNFS